MAPSGTLAGHVLGASTGPSSMSVSAKSRNGRVTLLASTVGGVSTVKARAGFLMSRRPRGVYRVFWGLSHVVASVTNAPIYSMLGESGYGGQMMYSVSTTGWVEQ